jgi:ERCC4-type nuclease
MMLIKVDTNAAETPLYDQLCALVGREHVRRERLDLGDVELVARDQHVLVERKAWSDWASSIADGRYKEQKARFLGSMKDHATLVYLIEGSLVGFEGKTQGISNKALNAAILKTQMRDGLTILRSRDTGHSAKCVAYLFEQLRAGGLDPSSARTVMPGKAKKRKRENLEAPQDLYRAMVAVVPGISDEKAEAISLKYPSMHALHSASVEVLGTLTCGKNNRRLGLTVATRLLSIFKPL